ncbi:MULTISPECIES: helicase associated domain-containing protein [unclassified Streptomyces]|uniref:helicase associated domain-containing protein n=1 Tax=unclassified Streptomyces TaxID=2593676 RepID=UPI002E163743
MAPRQDAVWGEEDNDLMPIGQLIANLRRTGGLGKNPHRAQARAKQLSEIDPDWNCPWPLDWQRHHAVLRDLTETEPGGNLPHIQPGVHFEGDDLGRWLQQQQQPHTWAQLTGEQQERLTGLGIQPAQRPAPTPAAKSGGIDVREGVSSLPEGRTGPRPIHRTGGNSRRGAVSP